MRRILLYASILALAVGVIGAVIGYAVSGTPGIIGAVIGAAIALIFPGITAASILFANRYSRSPQFIGIFFGVVMGGWLLKFIAFLAVVFLLRDQGWLNTQVLFLTMVVAVIGSLTIDVLVVARSRISVVSDLHPSRR
jgi:hypothetical protein